MYEARDDHRRLAVDPSLFADAPFFRAKRSGEKVSTWGTPSQKLGYRVAGPDGNGVFAEWTWDGETLALRTDRLGMYPIFYHASEDEVIVSTSVFKILSFGVDTRINWPGLGVFLRTGAFMSTDTPFAEVSGAPPNAHVLWKPGKLEVSGGYWIVPKRESSRSAAVDDYVDAFRVSVERRLPEGRFAMPLSGGRDSRHILFELDKQGCRPEFVVTGRRFPPERSVDERVAADVAGRMGIPHEIVGPPQREVPSYVAANVMTNLTAPRRGWKLSVVRKLSETVTTSYDGIGGDMLSGGSAINRKALELLDAGRYEEWCRTTFTNKMTDKVVPRSQLEHMSDDVVIEHMLPELELHLGAANPATSFHFWNRTRRFDSTNPFGMLRGLPTVHVPFLDLDLFEFLAGLPAEFNLGGWLHDDAIAKAYPDYADMPYEPSRPGVETDARHSRQSMRDVVAFLATERPRYLLRPGFYLRRILHSALSFGHSTRLWIPQLVYLTELESIVRRGVPTS